MHHIGVLPGNPDHSLVAARVRVDHDIQNFPGFPGFDPDGLPVQIIPDGFLLRIGNGGNDFQNPVRVPGDDPRGGGGLDAPQTAGVGNHHALDIFDNIAAGFHQGPLRQTAQGFPGNGGAVGNGDGLRAAHGGHQLLPQNPDIGPVANILFFHRVTSVGGKYVE